MVGAPDPRGGGRTYAEFQTKERAPHARGTSAAYRRHFSDVEAAPQPFLNCQGQGREGRSLVLRDRRILFEGCNAPVQRKSASYSFSNQLSVKERARRQTTVVPRTDSSEKATAVRKAGHCHYVPPRPPSRFPLGWGTLGFHSSTQLQLTRKPLVSGWESLVSDNISGPSWSGAAHDAFVW